MAEWVKYWPCKHKDLDSAPELVWESPETVGRASNTSAGETETGRSLGLIDQQISPLGVDF